MLPIVVMIVRRQLIIMTLLLQDSTSLYRSLTRLSKTARGPGVVMHAAENVIMPA